MNEHIRTCLRLEHLFRKAYFNLEDHSTWHARSALAAIIHIANILDRPDIKTKISKELRRHIDNLSKHLQTPGIDEEKLKQYLDKLETLYLDLQSLNGRIGQTIRDNEFLANIRQYLFNPAGACSFDIPNLHHWLQKPSLRRTQDLSTWLSEFDIVQSVVNVILEIVRGSGIAENKLAHDGFYQEAIDPKAPCQLIRVAIPREYDTYPEISSGRHRVSIRFAQSNLADRPSQYGEDVPFSLSYCII